MAQLTVRIPEDLVEALSLAARKAGLRRADIVRAALRSYLDQTAIEQGGPPIDRVRSLLGRFRAEVHDRGAEPRAAIVERIRRHARRPS